MNRKKKRRKRRKRVHGKKHRKFMESPKRNKNPIVDMPCS
jgi:hypothetical protein